MDQNIACLLYNSIIKVYIGAQSNWQDEGVQMRLVKSNKKFEKGPKIGIKEEPKTQKIFDQKKKKKKKQR